MSGRRLCVLIIDDSLVYRKIASAVLRGHGFDVLTAADGEEGLQAARTDLPNLILLDLIMPKIQGFEVLQMLKADLTTSKIPVVIMTNLAQDADRQHALRAGAAGYVVKSDMDEDLLKHVQAAIRSHEG